MVGEPSRLGKHEELPVCKKNATISNKVSDSQAPKKQYTRSQRHKTGLTCIQRVLGKNAPPAWNIPGDSTDRSKNVLPVAFPKRSLRESESLSSQKVVNAVISDLMKKNVDGVWRSNPKKERVFKTMLKGVRNANVLKAYSFAYSHVWNAGIVVTILDSTPS